MFVFHSLAASTDATERHYASHVMPVLVDLYRRHERACGRETDKKAVRENVELLYEIHHIDDLGPDLADSEFRLQPRLAAKVRKVMWELELKYEAKEALRNKIRLIEGGAKDTKLAAFRRDLPVMSNQCGMNFSIVVFINTIETGFSR